MPYMPYLKVTCLVLFQVSTKGPKKKTTQDIANSKPKREETKWDPRKVEQIHNESCLPEANQSRLQPRDPGDTDSESHFTQTPAATVCLFVLKTAGVGGLAIFLYVLEWLALCSSCLPSHLQCSAACKQLWRGLSYSCHPREFHLNLLL